MRVRPGKRRSRVERIGSTIQITIPKQAHIGTSLFLLAWLGAWTEGGYSALQEVLKGFGDGRVEWFLLFWLLAWAVGEVFALSSLFYMLGGGEVISISPGTLVVRHAILGIGLTSEYDASKIRALRASPQSAGEGQGTGAVCFDYGARTVHIARDIDEAEAAILISDLLATGLLPEGALPKRGQ